MLKPQEIAANHVDLFIERYERLFLWSLQLTEHDHEQAEDLLHDCFIQFTLGQPDLNSIQNLEGYLRTMLRNIHVSHVRRSTRSPIRSLSIVEYDSAELGLRVIDPRTQLNVQDELRTVCEYACARKESSKAGSILILRFFHGYYPDEISQVSRMSRPAVKERLRLARAEAKLYLDSPKSLTFMQGKKLAKGVFPKAHGVFPDFLTELRETVFVSRSGVCLTKGGLSDLYGGPESQAIESATLAHLVSCRVCLDAVNAKLNLPTLSTRHATETIGKDTPRKKGSSGGGPRGGTGMASVSEYLRRAKEVFEHEPQELFISVNGYLLGSQKISSELMEQTLNIKGEENIGFVEVFSEQQLRLLLLNIEPLPDGPVKQSAQVRLGEGRTLDVSLSFSGAWPTLHVVYRDPSLAQTQPDQNEIIVEEASAIAPPPSTEKPKRVRIRDSFRNAIVRSRGTFGDWSIWARPGMVTAILALILIAVSFLLWPHAPARVSASDLLARSIEAERVIATKPDLVLHRTVNLEERKHPTGELIAKRRIEVWQSAERGISARRLYDEKGALIAGDWRRSDGVQTLYHHGARPQLQISNPQSAIGTLNEVWQLEPSAKEFSQLIGSSQIARVEERANTYVINFESPGSLATPAVNYLVRTTLTLNRGDLHPIEQTLLIRQGNEIREYKLTETAFEQKAPDTVSPSVFKPEPELLLEARLNTLNPKPEGLTSTPGSQPPATVVAASAALEVEVLHLLNQAGANMGEQVNVTRTADGRLRVEGIVETEDRKRQILGTLDPVIMNPAVEIDVTTVAEALRKKSNRPRETASPGSEIVEGAESGTDLIPADKELRAYFTAKGLSGVALDNEIRRFSHRALAQSGEVMQHAWALRGIAQRFSPEALRTLDAEAKTKWLAIITQHAAALKRENKALRQLLEPVFPSAASPAGLPQSQISDETSLVKAVAHLFDDCAANDEVIRSAFSISPDPSRSSRLRTPQFGSSLNAVESLAARISDFRF